MEKRNRWLNSSEIDVSYAFMVGRTIAIGSQVTRDGLATAGALNFSAPPCDRQAERVDQYTYQFIEKNSNYRVVAHISHHHSHQVWPDGSVGLATPLGKP